MEHMILWAICSLMAMLILFKVFINMDSTKPDEDPHKLARMGDYKIAGNFLGIIFGSIFLGMPMWGFFELVYWLFT